MMKCKVFLFSVLILFSQLCLSDVGTEKKDIKVMNEVIIEKIKSHDESVIVECVTASDDLIKNILDMFFSFDLDSRMISIECFSNMNNVRGAKGLLVATMDDDLNVANEAVQYLRSRSSLIKVDDVFNALKNQDEPLIREHLYLMLGDSLDNKVLPELRDILKEESDPDAALSGLVSIVKLNGESERKVFLDMLHNAEADDARDFSEKLIYINDKSLAKGLVPWLTRQDQIFRLGSDRHPGQMVRICDLAVWTAQRLQIRFEPTILYLDIYSDDILKQATRLLSQIN